MQVELDDNLKPFDICTCGDYRKQHERSIFKCHVCAGDCTSFHLHKQAVHIDWTRSNG